MYRLADLCCGDHGSMMLLMDEVMDLVIVKLEKRVKQ